MANISVVQLPANAVGLEDMRALATAAAGGGADQFKNDGHTLLVIFNEDAAPQTVTVLGVPDENGRDGTSVVDTAAGEVSIVGPFKPSAWSVQSGLDKGYVQLTHSGDTDVKLLPLRII